MSRAGGIYNHRVRQHMKPMMTDVQDSSPFEVHGPVVADKAAELLWRQGELQKQWAKKYPELFDERDLEIFLNQRHHHFYEACAAIWWHERGYLCLVEKYDIKTPRERHPRKALIFHQCISPPMFERMWVAKKKHGYRGPPDLFVYKSDLSDWFFCEVKGPADKVRSGQSEFWKELEEIFMKRVRVLQFV